MIKQFSFLPLFFLFSFIHVNDNGSPALYDTSKNTAPLAVTDVTLLPIADAFVRSNQYAGINYGSDPTLLIKGSTVAGYSRYSYLKFSLSSISNLSAAKLRIYGNNTESTASINVLCYGVTNDAWTEGGITWTNAPAASGASLKSVGIANNPAYYDLDVTNFVQQQLAGDKIVSLVLKNPSNQAKTITLNSREAAFPPQLVITTDAGGNQPPVLAGIGNKQATVGQPLTFKASASDPDPNQTLTYSLINAPVGASIDPNSGDFSWTPSSNGNFSFTVRVTDDGSPNLFDDEQITVSVAVPNTFLTLGPIADAYVRTNSYAAINYGSDPALIIKGSTVAGYTRNSYFKFSLNDVNNVSAAKLRIYGNNTETATSINTLLYGVANDAWTETGITYSNAPAASPSTALRTVGITNQLMYYEYDVTSFVQQQLAGDKTVSFVLKNPSNQNTTLSFNSRENTSQPQLVISTNAGANQVPVLAPIGNQSVYVGQPVSFIASATDPDAGQSVAYSLIGAPAGAVIDPVSGNFSWTPAASGNYTFGIRATDNGATVLFDEETITVSILSPAFSNTGTIGIPNAGAVEVPVTVSGLPDHIDTTSYGLQSVNVKITHPSLKELTLQLKSPDGKVIYLSRKSPGKNYNTTFDAVSNQFIDNNEIAPYTGSYTGGYRPRQELSLLNNGQNPNGTWSLVVTDDTTSANAGTVTGVTLVFGVNPAKPLLSSSSLPIIKIYTANGVDILDDPKVLADMYIINNGAGAYNYANQTSYQYQGKIGIEIRGNSTATDPNIPKKQYGFETRLADGVTSTDVSFFGMPKQSDWILSAVLSDKSLMRNVLTYQIAREMGWYASRTQFCEVMINDEYRGVFIFEEKIKKDKNRVPIEKMDVTDVTDPNVTGGYIFAVDDLDPGDITWKSKFPPLPVNPFKFVYPKPTDLQPAQQTYLQNYVGDFETALHGDNFQDPVEGFRKYADDKSFIDFFLINEVAKNSDAYRYSTYFYKKRGGKIVAGPVWDFDRSFRNEVSCSTFVHTGYIYSQINNCGGRVVSWWWPRLLEDTKYKQDLVCRYNTLRQTTLSVQHLHSIIDSSAAVLNAGAQQRNFIRWNVLGKYVERNPAPYPATYALEIDTLKNWVTNRMAWLDADMGACPGTLMAAKDISHNITGLAANTIQAIYPSPFKSHLSVAMNLNRDQNVNIQLVDIDGKVYYQKTSMLRKGSQAISLDFTKKQLARGLYILHINGENINFNKKVLKE